MSSHLQWMVVRNNSAFLLKGAHGQTFTTEPNNLKNKNSFRFSGLVQPKTVGVAPTKESDGVVLTTRKTSFRNKPAKSMNTVTFKTSSGPRRVLNKIRNTLRKTRYRKDLKMAALRRASALMRAQRTKVAPAAKTASVKKD